MNLGLIANSRLALPTIQHLLNSKEIKALAIPDQLNPDTEQILLLAQQYGVSVTQFSKADLEQQLSDWIKINQLELVLVFTFPWVISENCLNLPKHGFYNFHFAPLPAYRGAAPLFWLIKNREREGALSIHKMEAALDALLRIEVIKLEEGYFSGWKLFEMGIRPGSAFSSLR